MSKPIEEILAPKPEARPRIYAYSIADAEHAGLLRVGKTTRDVKQRVAEQLKTAAIRNYTIELDKPAERVGNPPRDWRTTGFTIRWWRGIKDAARGGFG